MRMCSDKFSGLDAHAQWDWSVKYPVLHLSFGGGQYLEPKELQNNISEQLDDLDKAFGHSTTHTTLSGRFKALIRLGLIVTCCEAFTRRLKTVTHT